MVLVMVEVLEKEKELALVMVEVLEKEHLVYV